MNDESNPGNQLLRKMGWDTGKGLGKDGKGMEESVGVKLADIEKVSEGNRGVAGIGSNTGIPPVNYKGEGKAYKDSLLRAAKARYDQVSKQ